MFDPTKSMTCKDCGYQFHAGEIHACHPTSASAAPMHQWSTITAPASLNPEYPWPIPFDIEDMELVLERRRKRNAEQRLNLLAQTLLDEAWDRDLDQSTILSAFPEVGAKETLRSLEKVASHLRRAKETAMLEAMGLLNLGVPE